MPAPTNIALETHERKPLHTSPTLLLLAVLLFIMVSGIGSIFAILYLRPDQDNLPIFTMMFTFFGVLVSGLFALLNKKVDDTQHLVDGRMTELVKKTEQVAEALGYEKAMKEEEQIRERLLAEAQDKARIILENAATVADRMLLAAERAAERLKAEAATATAAVLTTAQATIKTERKESRAEVAAAKAVMHTAAATAADTVVETAKLAAAQLLEHPLSGPAPVPPAGEPAPVPSAGEPKTALALEVTGTLHAAPDKAPAKKPDDEKDTP